MITAWSMGCITLSLQCYCSLRRQTVGRCEVTRQVTTLLWNHRSVCFFCKRNHVVMKWTVPWVRRMMELKTVFDDFSVNWPWKRLNTFTKWGGIANGYSRSYVTGFISCHDRERTWLLISWFIRRTRSIARANDTEKGNRCEPKGLIHPLVDRI